MPTSNRDYTLPPVGLYARQTLGSDVNANFEAIDTDVQDALDTASTAEDGLPETVSDTQSGDGSATTFTIAHDLDGAPSAAVVIPTSAAAAGEFHVSDKTADNVEITYGTAPSDATDNLSWDVVMHP